MRTIYYTKTVSERNIERGFFEESDFGEIKILELSEGEAEKFLSITKYPDSEIAEKQNLRELGNIYLTDKMGFPFSRKDEAEWIKKQGHWTDRTCIELGIMIREQTDNYYSGAYDKTFYLVRRRLYCELCKKSKLSITQCGNTIFGNWHSIDIEPHHSGKGNTRFTKARFESAVKKAQEWIDNDNVGRKEKIYFSYPKIKVYKRGV